MKSYLLDNRHDMLPDWFLLELRTPSTSKTDRMYKSIFRHVRRYIQVGQVSYYEPSTGAEFDNTHITQEGVSDLVVRVHARIMFGWEIDTVIRIHNVVPGGRSLELFFPVLDDWLLEIKRDLRDMHLRKLGMTEGLNLTNN